MKAFSLFLVGALAALIVAAQPPTQAQSFPSIARSQSGGLPDLRGDAEQIFALGNQARAQTGVARLVWDPDLAEAALEHCRRMATEGPLSHRYGGELSLTARAAKAGAYFSLIEENLAIGPTPGAIHQSWMQSPEHRANLLNPQVNHVGIAVVYARGVLYAVADFSAAVMRLNPQQIEAQVSSLLRSNGVAPLPKTAVARAACASDESWLPPAANQPAWMIRWQNSDLSHLPQQLLKQLKSGKYRGAAVGACPAHLDNTAFTSYRVAVLLY
ncbi:MAG: CAP domain-containing protein [Terracidiphilus sp.]